MILVIDLESYQKKVSQEFPPNFPKIILYKGQAYKWRGQAENFVTSLKNKYQ